MQRIYWHLLEATLTFIYFLDLYIFMATHKALVLHQYGTKPQLQQVPRPVAGPGQLLIKIQAVTINPSDRYRVAGTYFPIQLPATMGLEGAGRVVQANGQQIQSWVGKRVSFAGSLSGTWAEYSIAYPDTCFPITEDVPIHIAASGVVNPLTVIGMTDIFQKTPVRKGIIHTAAASALGRQLNKRCIALGIPLLNIVRRQEQAALLRSQGAEHVIVTQGDWETQYKEAIKNHGFNVYFDALGGGPIVQKLIVNLNQNSWVHIYGLLTGEPLSLKSGISLCKGINVTGYLVFNWWSPLSAEKKQEIKNAYSSWLKGQLSTTSLKILKFSDISQALELSASQATEGKITLTPN